MDKKTYLGNFGCWADVVQQFNLNEHESLEPEMIWALYDLDGYEGSAYIFFREDHEWYAVYGGHCSCYGLEDQWAPEEFDPNLYFKGLSEGHNLLRTPYHKEDEDNLNEWLLWAKDQ